LQTNLNQLRFEIAGRCTRLRFGAIFANFDIVIVVIVVIIIIVVVDGISTAESSALGGVCR
jgi:hypothetical protein